MSKRCPNFTINEENFLLQLVNLRKNVLENKKTDRTTIAKKTKAWIDLEEEFNEKFGHIFRNAKELRTKYDNLKKKRKKVHMAMAGNVYGIGGGIKSTTATSDSDSVIHKLSSFIEDEEDLNDGEITPTNIDRFTHNMSPFVEDEEDLNGGEIKAITPTTNNVRVTHNMSPFVEDEEQLNGESSIDPLMSSATNKLQAYELQKFKVEEHELQIKKQELVIEMTKKEHNLMIMKMELELEISKLQLEQMRNDVRNIMSD